MPALREEKDEFAGYYSEELAREMIDSSDGACWLDLIICVLE